MRALIIVRRGASERAQILRETFAGEPVELIRDRRLGERRQIRGDPITIERRRRDRRGLPPITWPALDFVVVHRPDR
jgi:hypothetical protein